MKYLVLSLSLFAAQMSLATTANDFAGHYTLENETILHKNNMPICSDSLDLSISGNAMNVVTMAFNVTSEINVRHIFSSREPSVQYDSQCVYVKN